MQSIDIMHKQIKHLIGIFTLYYLTILQLLLLNTFRSQKR